jgi:hypothetical protein
MNIRDHAQTLLQHVASEFPQETAPHDLQFDQNDECFLTIDDNLAILMFLDEESRSLTLTLPIVTLPEGSAREAVMLELLRGNYSWSVTEGGTLGVDRETDLVCVSYLVPLPLAEAAQMPVILNKLISVVLHWRREIQVIAAGAEAQPDSLETVTMLRA